MTRLSQWVQRRAAILAGAVVAIINLVVLLGIVPLSAVVLGGLNAVIVAILGFLVTLVPVVQLSRVRSTYLQQAREMPERMVPTAAGRVGEVYGRDELCRVLIEAVRDRRTRRPHVVIGSFGTGKTALLVRLTKLFADQGLFSAGWPGGISPPGSHRTERDSLPSLRSSHL
jgi:hypothetical protein